MGEIVSATHLARAIIRQLIEIGVSDFVLSPGSRNAPLSIALQAAAERGLIELHVRIDERGAAFYALGLAKATGKYVPVICTSGTAVANYHPAALEAYHSEVKLLLLTADRPARLRKTGANQTTDQVAIFPNLSALDIAEMHDFTTLLTGGPVHINVQFDEPLLSDDESDWLAGISVHEPTESLKEPVEATFAGKGVLVIGHDRAGFSSSDLNEFAEKLSWPIIAEDPLSFPNAIAHASLFLAEEKIRKAFAAEQVIVIGRTTLSRSINAFIQQAGKTFVIDPRMENIDTERQADQIFYSLPELSLKPPVDSQWHQLWNRAAEITEEVLSTSILWSEQEAIRTITESLPLSSALFIGSSRPIRDVEGFARPREGIDIYANRGLAGIDGNLSTIIGIANKYQHAYAIVGDLTFLHDVSALTNIPKINLTIFVIDNNGGGIFSTLPQAGVKGFEDIFGTPHNHDIAKIARGFGLPAERVKSSSDLKHIIAHQDSGVEVVVIEVPTREENAVALKQLAQSVSSAVRIGSNLD